uniref:Nucleotide-diphospho-sugar transferase domain-containing protein n=1 Tax=Kalanchoe fedtschenkoi TaxID=63787 RepID=A0A7N0U4N5_KALFE
MAENARGLSCYKLCAVAFGVAFVSFVLLTAWLPSNTPISRFMTWSASTPNPQCHPSSHHHNLQGGEDETLESILARTPMTQNKTLIIAVVNKAYVEHEVYNGSATMLDTFLQSFWLGENTRPLLDNLLLVAADQTAYDRCRFLRLNCFKMRTEGVDFGGEKLYMSNDFIKMMWRRTELLLHVLKLGFNFIFTDTDVLWLRNPYMNLSNDMNIDLQISCDKFNNHLSSKNALINTGFYFVRSNNRTIALFDKWHSMKDNSTGKKEQDVLLDLIRDNIFGRLNLTARYLDSLYFNGFCSPRRDIRVVTTVHANCCRSIRAKVSDLTAVLRDWQAFKKSAPSREGVVNGTTSTAGGRNRTVSYDWSKPVNCANSWK